MNKPRQNRPDFLTPGTVSCALFCGIIAVVIAVLLLCIGFWKTLFIVIMLCIGLFIGGVSDKWAFLKSFADKTIPGKAERIYKADDVQIRKHPEEKASAEVQPAAEETASASEEQDAGSQDKNASEETDETDASNVEEEASGKSSSDPEEEKSTDAAYGEQSTEPKE